MILRSQFSYQLNFLYSFTLENFAFANLTQDELFNILKKGNNISPFLEIYLAKTFNLNYVNQTHYDFLDQIGNKIEQKTFTKYGCCFMPSTFRNNGYESEDDLMKVCYENIYLLCDITNFPEIKVVFKKGVDLFKEFPNGKISFSNKNKIFP
jgi:hypothetical protein